MKSIISILLVLSFLMLSCRKDFLEIIPKSGMTTDLVFKTDNDYKVAVNGIYRQLQDFYDDYWELSDLRGDDVEHWALRDVERVNIDRFATDVNSSTIDEAWLELYKIIRSANTVLAKLESAEPNIIKGKNQFEGESRFIRALSYFELVRIFGDVPMITEPVITEDALQASRTSVNVIYDEVIIKDLQIAESLLPQTYASSDVGAPTKGAAKSLLGKVYLTIHDFNNAESKLMEVTSMGYSLLENWKDLFNYDNEHHSEYIFDIEYIGGNVGLGNVFATTFMYEDQDVGSDLVNAMFDVFKFSGRHVGGGAGSPTQDFMNLWDPNDVRMDKSVRTGIYDLDSNWIESAFKAERITLKWIEPGYNFDISGNGRANWRIIRYADVLLMLAEAMNENGKTNEALAYLNQVRVRAGLAGYQGLSQDEARSKILDERRFELFLEGHRWFDLVRTGRALSACSKYGMQPHMIVFPIPQTQIEVVNNPEIFDQNEGY